MKKNSIKTYSLSAVFSALLCISAWISVPTPVPFTLQTLVVAAAGAFLGAKRGFLSVLIYLLLGIIGLPVFAGFNSGFGVLLGPTGGFTLGFLVFSVICGLASKNKSGLWQIFGAMFLGLIACYIIGSFWYCFVYSDSPQSLWAVLTTCVLPFIIPDTVKIFLATILVKKLKIHIK